MASSQNGNSSEFRLRAKRILLTYSQVGPCFDHQSIVHLIGRLGARGIICRELHKDGGIHYHALLFFDTTYHTRNPAQFDAGDTHPNILPVRWTPRKAYDYCRKDGDVVFNNLNDDDIDGGGGNAKSIWNDIIAAPDKTSFYDTIKSLDPRALVCSFTSIEKYAEWAYREDPAEYESPVSWADGDFSDAAELCEWYKENAISRTNGR